MSANVYQMVTDRIIAELEKGLIPWRKPWSGTKEGAYNRVTGKPYSLLNQLLLKHQGEYATYKQIQEAGGHVRKGEKSEIVVFWKIQSIKEETEDGTEEVKQIPLLKYYNVFHVATQCEGIEPKPIAELKELGFLTAQFDIRFNEQPSFNDCKFISANGFDSIEFLFSANTGEPLKPLSSVISGGEMSRFMLAIKAQTARYNNLSTFVFDEIDAGISGNTARIVAEKFAKIALTTQIIAITHLPQISSMADNNLLIEKNVKDGKTLTKVNELKGDEIVNEIVRLVGGEKDSDFAKNHAMELIRKSNEYKKSLKNSN